MNSRRRAGRAGRRRAFPRPALPRRLRAPAPRPHPRGERPARPGHRVVAGDLDRGGQPGRRGRGELHVPLPRHRQLRLADRRPADAGPGRLAAHRLLVLRGQPGRARCCWTGMRAARPGVSYDINVRPTVITDPDEYWSKVQPWLRVVGRRQGHRQGQRRGHQVPGPSRRSSRPGASDPVEVAAGWVEQYGLGLAVITLGPGGGGRRRAGRQGHAVPGFPTKVVDTVGAGDTFMAGFLDGCVSSSSSDLEASLRRGAAAASIVCSRRGAQPPTSAEVDDLIEAERDAHPASERPRSARSAAGFRLDGPAAAAASASTASAVRPADRQRAVRLGDVERVDGLSGQGADVRRADRQPTVAQRSGRGRTAGPRGRPSGPRPRRRSRWRRRPAPTYGGAASLRCAPGPPAAAPRSSMTVSPASSRSSCLTR